MQTLQQFIDTWNGKFLEVAGSANAKNQCVDLANGYIRDVLGLPIIEWTNAQDFPNKRGDNFDYILNTPTGVPPVGSLVIFKSKDGVGHISVFVSGTASLFTSFDQNYPTGSPCKLVSHNYVNVLGWMVAKKPPTSPEPAQNDWNGVLAHFKVKDAKELVEMVDREFGFLASAREEIKQLTDIFNQRREKLAQNLMTVNDWDEIIVASGRFKGLDEKNQDLQIKLEKEQQAHKQTVLDYQAKLEALSREMDEMKKRHETQIDNLQAKVDKEIAELKKAKEQYESVSKVIGWFKSIFKKG